MSDKFLGSGQGSINLSNGSATIYSATLGAASLDPSRPVKTNSVKQLISANLDISEVNNLATQLTEKDELTFVEDDTHTTPAVGKNKIYFKTDGNFYKLDDTGTETQIGEGSTDLQQAYDNSITNPEILTTSIGGALNIRRGSALDTDNVLTVQNGSGTNTFEVNGNGLVKIAGKDTVPMTQGIGGDPYNYFLSHTATYPSITTGTSNIAIGDLALNSITSGTQNVAIGHLAGSSLTTGVWNTLLGDDAGTNLDTGKENTCIGFDALLNGVNTGRNVAVGEAALWNNSNTDLTAGNVALGYFAGAGATSTIRTTNLGYQAKTGGSYASSMGSDANASAPYAISLGSDSINATANSCVIGGKTAATTEIVNIRPGTTNVCDLGTSGVKFKDLYLNGTAQASQLNIFTNTTPEILLRDTDTADINSFLAQISFQNSAGADAARLVYSSGKLTLENSGNSNIEFDTLNSIVPAVTNTNDLGTTSLRFKDLYMSGTALVDTKVRVGSNADVFTSISGDAILQNPVLGKNVSLQTDAHSLIVDDTAKSIRSSNDNWVDLGTPSFRYKDAYIAGTATVDTSVITPTIKDITQTTSIDLFNLTPVSGTLVQDTFTGGSIQGGTLGGSATFVPGNYLQLTPETLPTQGSITYDFNSGDIGTDLTFEFELFVGNTTGQDGNGISVFFGTTTPTQNISTAGNTTFTLYTYDIAGDRVQYRIQTGGTVLLASLSALAGNLLNNQWVPVKFTIVNNIYTGYVTDMNTPLYTYAAPVSLLGTETKIGLIAQCQGVDSAYRVRNLTITRPAVSGGGQVAITGDLDVSGNIIKSYGFLSANGNALQTATSGTYAPVLITSSIVSTILNDFTYAGTGNIPRLTYINSTPKIFSINVSLSGSMTTNNASVIQYVLYKNGNEYNQSCAKVLMDGNDLDPNNVSISCLIALEQNDYINLLVRNLTRTDSIIVECYSMVITQV